VIYQDSKSHRAHSRLTQIPWEEEPPRFSLINGLALSAPFWALIIWWLA
jgi:hypothetical protein